MREIGPTTRLICAIIFYVILVLYFTACANPRGGAADLVLQCEINTENDLRPDILVIGDSISMEKAPESVAQGYLPYIQENLPNYDLVHNYCNARSSVWTVDRVDAYLDQRPAWYAITFNNGLHDTARAGKDPNWLDTYRANLTIIAQKVKAKTTRPLFILTTEILPGTPGHDVNEVPDANAVAIQVMAQEGIPVVDLYTLSTTIPHLHLSPTDVHFTDAGSDILGDYITQELFNIYGIAP